MGSRIYNSIRNISYGLFSKCITMILPFIIRSLLIRKMGIEYGGLSSLFSSILNFLSLTELGFGTTLVYMMYEPVANNEINEICALLDFFKKIYTIIGCSIVIAGIVILPFLNYFINGTVPGDVNVYYLYFIYLFNTSLSYFLFAYRASLFVAFQRTDIQSKIVLISHLLMSFGQLISVVYFSNFYYFAISNILFTVSHNILIYVVSKKYFPEIKCKGKLDTTKVKNICSRTAILAGHKVGGTIVGSLDNIVISSILGLSAAGIYGNYYTLLSVLMAFIGVYINAIIPSIGNYVIEKNEDQTYSLFMRLNFLHVWIVGWISVGLLVLLPEIVELWVGRELVFDKTQTVLIVVYFYSWQFRVLLCNFKDAAGLWTQDALKPYIASVINVVLNIYLVKRIGISGALISTIICMILIFFPWETKVIFRCLLKKREYEFCLKELLWLLIWVVISGVTVIVCKLVNINGIMISIVLKFIICITIPNMLFIILCWRTQEFSDVRRIILYMIKKQGFSPMDN